MTKELETFIQTNRGALVKQYAEYLDNMLETEEYEMLENPLEWIEEELEVAKEYKAKGTPMAEYEL